MIPIAYPDIREEEMAAVEAVLRSRNLAQGRVVEEFEAAFASYIGVKHAVAVNSGTAALHVALLAHGIGPGDEVITTPFSFTATANTIVLCGATPVFVDIDPLTFNLDTGLGEAAITPSTRALLPVHLYGQPCDMDSLMAIAAKHGLAVIEDACQAHGAEYRGKRVGSFGTGCFSFYPTKNMTTGEGGIITTDDDHIAAASRVLRNHGQRERYVTETIGLNYRMTDMAAAIGLCQLRRLEVYTEARIAHANTLSEGLREVAGIAVPSVAPNVRHVFHQYTVRVGDGFSLSRDQLQQALAARGVGSAVHYPIPLHRQPFYAQNGHANCVLPHADSAAREVLSLPVHPHLNEQDLRTVVNGITATGGAV